MTYRDYVVKSLQNKFTELTRDYISHIERVESAIDYIDKIIIKPNGDGDMIVGSIVNYCGANCLVTCTNFTGHPQFAAEIRISPCDVNADIGEGCGTPKTLKF